MKFDSHSNGSPVSPANFSTASLPLSHELPLPRIIFLDLTTKLTHITTNQSQENVAFFYPAGYCFGVVKHFANAALNFFPIYD